ncbi:uncharacterized protein LOC100213215 isoform X1 [Hydra vulgaris]|uniref:uncharacterized protein LOC100213215 isoform X1 n=1 Tax=Hydra vulgaris TaxID=6087 RepID=UPI001F5FBD9C|nr:uncharacterized protein LOC100213215 isoform X1 [Hydra vulgaris]XP_047126395.1 uncharacterized protein LOC100213215 isoform X1 [Hydra vulgaris]XP_047126396.1 uncharacterized protein LOC100213215 isoform X1 [Hydra vulgaris]
MADYDGNASQTGWRKWITFAWVTTPLGLLKIAEFVVLLLALAIMGSIPAMKGGETPAVKFFMFVASTSAISVFITILLYLLNLFKRLPSIVVSNAAFVICCGRLCYCYIAFVICCGVAVLSLLIASSVSMTYLKSEDRALAGGSFGLIAMFLFLFEFVFYFINLRKNGPRASTSNPISGAEDLIPPA